MTEIKITEAGIKKLLTGLNPNKAASPDQIKPRVLKELADDLTSMVTLIFKAPLVQSRVRRDYTSHSAIIFIIEFEKVNTDKGVY